LPGGGEAGGRRRTAHRGREHRRERARVEGSRAADRPGARARRAGGGARLRRSGGALRRARRLRAARRARAGPARQRHRLHAGLGARARSGRATGRPHRHRRRSQGPLDYRRDRAHPGAFVSVRLSATVLAQDEAERIGGCIESLRFCDEVLVVDGGSRDGTRELAARLGARVVERPFDDFARQHEFARTQACGEWILSIDADERASPELAAAAPGALRGAASAYALPFKNHFRGVWLRHGGFWPDRHVRLFRKDRCRYDPERPVHEKLLVDGATARLDAPVLHHTWGSLAHCLAKMERYGERAAQALFAQGRRAAAWEVALRPLWRFVRGYLLRAGFLDGAPGAEMAWARAYEAYARYGRLWELARFPGSARDALR